ncbi:MAG: hypothetical protein ABIQ46_11415 [Alteraurantiacibacter sp.]
MGMIQAASNAWIGAAMADYYPRFSLSGLFGGNSTQAAGVLGLRGATLRRHRPRVAVS